MEVHKLDVAKSSYHPATISVSQKLVLFNLFIIILGNGTEYSFGTLADNSKLEGGGVKVERRTATLEFWRTKLM